MPSIGTRFRIPPLVCPTASSQLTENEFPRPLSSFPVLFPQSTARFRRKKAKKIGFPSSKSRERPGRGEAKFRSKSSRHFVIRSAPFPLFALPRRRSRRQLSAINFFQANKQREGRRIDGSSAKINWRWLLGQLCQTRRAGLNASPRAFFRGTCRECRQLLATPAFRFRRRDDPKRNARRESRRTLESRRLLSDFHAETASDSPLTERLPL